MRLIDADALMADLEKWLKQIDPTHPPEDNSIPPMEDIIVSTLMTIEEQPTIEPQRMKGKWESTVIGKARHIRCSSCKVGYYAKDVPHDLSGNVALKYCPECGAWMGGQNE